MKQDMRVTVTKRMLKEGILKCLRDRPLSKIKVSDLCRESGINRATFYNHYDSPAMILREIAQDYADQIFSIYRSNPQGSEEKDSKALEASLTYIYEKRDELKVLFSKNAENCLSGFCMDIVRDEVKKNSAPDPQNAEDKDHFLVAITLSSAIFGLIQTWLMFDIDRTPKELVSVINKTICRELIY